MKHIIITAAITFFVSFNCISQTTYQNGYYVNNNNQKIECLIKNEDWKNNPSKIIIKHSQDDQPVAKTIESVKEFQIDGRSRYIRATVKIDNSSESSNALDNTRNPIFKEEQVFLNVLVEGKASLYSYEGRNFQKFFFRTEDSDIEQLFFKRYLEEDNQIAENNYFRQQLSNTLKCRDITTKDIENLKYKPNKLVNLIIEYNKCLNAPYTRYWINSKKITSNWSLKAGVKTSSVEIKNSEASTHEMDLDNRLGFRVGIEAEFIMPVKNKKWSLLVEPTYQNYVSKIEEGIYTTEVSYHSIEVPLGVRHYVFLDRNSGLFLNGMFVMEVDLGSKFKSKRPTSTFDKTTGIDLKAGPNVGLGIGYTYNKKYSAELRYYTDKNLETLQGDWHLNYSSLSLIFGYSLF